ncbi:uncharacterized protein BJ171DRAFT_511567 [Polychytrium aggregatum]|uniref:uncharacterized protein n=1 Tax=Polychytrium aggregatum TaxID=110093 RepID=UPI0022FDF879|nr:uncharacterized protein BJ171DRAFT_511567 [Polychytrium aggregatum]KAI9203018.1 hypothetical protein BJ171DRAFT_511567 [Polychytrium aggregatum]
MAKAEKVAVSKKKTTTSTKSARKPNPYNVFMKDELKKLKDANPSLSHREAFKQAASNWKTSDRNPKKE